ncbi:MAG: M20/M25/M40 family metallo-hydrolase [Acidobacteria bacterium]|nr:M20/M25/M40 family metallo-hydrolase [Acidobacteriota bacterium]
MSTPPVDRDFIVSTLAGLVRLDSINPSIAPEGAGEAAIARSLARTFESLGLDVEILEGQAGRPSVLGTLRGTGGGPSLMFNGHEDTVGVEGMPGPFSAEIRGKRMYGRGTHDMKGSLAACAGAVKALVDGRVRLRGDVVVAAVADEEYGSLGTREVLAHRKVDAAIVTEPTNLAICLAHKGYVWIEVETKGRAAHGSRFTEGIDANLRMGRFLARLEGLERSLRTGPSHPLVGPPSLHAALLRGGSGMSTYAERCRLTIERRTVPGETERSVFEPLMAAAAGLHSEDPSFVASVRSVFARNPWEVSPDAAIVRVLADAATGVLGERPAFIGDTPWMDAALLAEAGVETVVMGPTGAGEHSAVEWVDLDSVVTFAELLATAAILYCGTEQG